MYYDWNRWSHTVDEDGRVPVFTAAARSVKWWRMKQIFALTMPLVCEKDLVTGLPLCLLAAVGPTSDLESVYNLLKEYPFAIQSMNDDRQVDDSFTERSKKRGADVVQNSNAKISKVHY